MEKNHQPDQPFLHELGVLLAAHASQQHSAPLPTMSPFADYVTSARRAQKLTRAALAQKMGKTEAEIFALEHGLLAYADLDLGFLSNLAAALDEDVETLLLLLGRPALAHFLQEKKQAYSPKLGYPPPSTGAATPSKQHGNPFKRRQGLNGLRKGCLNLIDSWQQGRLCSTISVNYRFYPITVMVACLFLIGVSTYSLASRFGAQSDGQVSVVMSARPDGLSPMQIRHTVDYPPAPVRQRYSQLPEAVTQAATLSVTSPTTVRITHDIAPEPQQCDWRMVGRFALCRI